MSYSSSCPGTAKLSISTSSSKSPKHYWNKRRVCQQVLRYNLYIPSSGSPHQTRYESFYAPLGEITYRPQCSESEDLEALAQRRQYELHMVLAWNCFQDTLLVFCLLAFSSHTRTSNTLFGQACYRLTLGESAAHYIYPLAEVFTTCYFSPILITIGRSFCGW